MAAPKGHKKWGGRRKGVKNKETIEKERLLKYLTKQVIKTKGKWIPALIKRMNEGDIRAVKEALDRILGKARESLDITSEGERLYNWGKYGKDNNILPEAMDKGTPRRKSKVEGSGSTQKGR